MIPTPRQIDRTLQRLRRKKKLGLATLVERAIFSRDYGSEFVLVTELLA